MLNVNNHNLFVSPGLNCHRDLVHLYSVANVRLALVGSSSGKGEPYKIPGNVALLQVASKSNYIPLHGTTPATYSQVWLIIESGSLVL